MPNYDRMDALESAHDRAEYLQEQVDALQARLAAAEGLLREAREAFDRDAWDDPAWSMARRIDAHLAPAPTKPVRCWDRDLCCGDDLCKFQNGEQLPPNTYCAHDDKPEGGEVGQ